ncbi:neuropeptide FF receptor 2 [Nematostella vectensis]|uniref:neuropeptide FF receptor 2 n=1 Tax=Nematostella vectensis TaxID=45351 RepID=UPI00207779C2|nr:neuropeptide FF receptor 2 [Nematostella vectensis]
MTSDILADAALAALFAVLVAVDIIGNAFVCFVILKHRFGVTLIHTRTAMDYLLANLAASDILLGVFVIPRYIIPGSVNPMGFKGDLLCKFVTGGVFIWVGGAASVFSLILIAAERYSSVVYPHKPNLRISKARLPDVLLSCWIFAFILNSPLFIFMVYDEKSEFCVEEWPSYVLPRAYGILWLLYGGLVPIAAMACLYAQIIRSLWFKHPSLTINSRSNVQKTMALFSRRKATKLCLTVTIIYATCWLPILVLYIVSFHRPELVAYGSFIYKASVALTLLNSGINPFVYALQSQKFLKCIKKALQCKLGNK